MNYIPFCLLVLLLSCNSVILVLIDELLTILEEKIDLPLGGVQNERIPQQQIRIARHLQKLMG